MLKEKKVGKVFGKNVTEPRDNIFSDYLSTFEQNVNQI